MRRNQRKKSGVKLEMTPMIDVVFQLLVFFVISYKTVDTLAQLEVLRQPPSPSAEQQVDALTIRVMADGLYLNDVKCTPEELAKRLGLVTRGSTDQPVNVICDRRSKHVQLIMVLDTCEGLELGNLNIGSI